jgi:hypothetical protein
MLRKSLILILAGVFVLSLSAFVSNFIRARNTSASNACINNLRQIDGAKQQWALENQKTANDVPSWDDIRPYLGRGPQGDLSGLRCPNGGTYTIGRVADPPTCSVGGPKDSLDYDYSKENRYSMVVESLCLLSFLALLVALFLPKKMKGQDHGATAS